MEQCVADLGAAVADLQHGRASAATAPGAAAIGTTAPDPLLAAAGSLLGTVTNAQELPHGSEDHGDAFLRWEQGPVATPVPLPGIGQLPSSPSVIPVSSPFSHASQLLAGLGQTHPSISFPKFTGENPKLWKTLCEQYFSMFGIHTSFWVPMASLNFSGSAAIWLQSVQKKLTGFDWESFSTLLCTRFGRDRHQLLIRQFYTIKQTTSVSDYIEQFQLIINHLASYSDAIHPYYYLTRFVEGLRADIRAVVLVQRPPDLGTACSLALLQEEVAGCASPPLHPLPSPRAPDAGGARIWRSHYRHLHHDRSFQLLHQQQQTGAGSMVPALTIPRARLSASTAVLVDSASSVGNGGGKGISALPRSKYMWSKNCLSCCKLKTERDRKLGLIQKRKCYCPYPN